MDVLAKQIKGYYYYFKENFEKYAELSEESSNEKRFKFRVFQDNIFAKCYGW
jgi:hypothetical protein